MGKKVVDLFAGRLQYQASEESVLQKSTPGFAYKANEQLAAATHLQTKNTVYTVFFVARLENKEFSQNTSGSPQPSAHGRRQYKHPERKKFVLNPNLSSGELIILYLQPTCYTRNPML